MNTSNKKQDVLVWDFPVRVFHWLLVISFAGAWLTSESEAQQMIQASEPIVKKCNKRKVNKPIKQTKPKSISLFRGQPLNVK
jgi:hypothetical protein